MSLDKDFQNLKETYRKIFTCVVQDIDSRIKSGESIEHIDALYHQESLNSLKIVNADRKNYKCIGCGGCCRFAVSEFSPEELRNKAKSGDNYASQFIKTFVPYSSLEEAAKIYPEYVEFLNQNTDGEFYIYHCPKVTSDNRCPDYENRPQICRDFPDNPLGFLPKSCAFLPWKENSQSVCLKINAEREIINFYLN